MFILAYLLFFVFCDNMNLLITLEPSPSVWQLYPPPKNGFKTSEWPLPLVYQVPPHPPSDHLMLIGAV